jgi:cytoskeletal protein CcmA (bactofilin family)
MFFGQNKQKAISTETLATLMDTSVKIEGNFFFDKSARLDGVIVGNIRGPNTKTGVLIIGPKAQIDGNISCHSVVVLGAVFGNIEADHLEVRAGAKINGDVLYSIIEVHQGSNINGRMVLKSSEKSLVAETEANVKKTTLGDRPDLKKNVTPQNIQESKLGERTKNITEQPLS